MSEFLILRDVYNRPTILKDETGQSIGDEKLLKKLLNNERSRLRGKPHHLRIVLSYGGYLAYLILDINKIDYENLDGRGKHQSYAYKRNLEKIKQMINFELREYRLNNLIDVD